MPAKIPTQHKTPFAIDARPLIETTTSQASLLAFSRALRSLHLPGLAEATLRHPDLSGSEALGRGK